MRFVIVAVQIAIVMLFSWAAFVFGPAMMPQPLAIDTASRLAYAVQWLLIPGLVLLVLTLTTAQYRFFNKPYIDGTRSDLPPFLEINLRTTQNTLEQTMLAVITWPALALMLPPERLGLIPVTSILFGAGRVMFWIGYQLHPLARIFGFALSSVPTALALLWLCLPMV
jgi:hypothetical protein